MIDICENIAVRNNYSDYEYDSSTSVTTSVTCEYYQHFDDFVIISNSTIPICTNKFALIQYTFRRRLSQRYWPILRIDILVDITQYIVRLLIARIE